MTGKASRMAAAAACLAALPALAASPATAQQQSLAPRTAIENGRIEFMAKCAVCHGADARGEGPYAMFLTVEPTDLTQLAAGNGGTFPFGEVYSAIDGRANVDAHGTREMPVWGLEYNEEAKSYYRRLLGPVNAENYVTSRILYLIRYLESIQD